MNGESYRLRQSKTRRRGLAKPSDARITAAAPTSTTDAAIDPDTGEITPA